MGHRLGSAFVLLGLIVLTVFLLVFSVGQQDSGLLLAGAALSLFGLALRRRNARLAKSRPRRFSALRSLMGQGEEEQE